MKYAATAPPVPALLLAALLPCSTSAGLDRMNTAPPSAAELSVIWLSVTVRVELTAATAPPSAACSRGRIGLQNAC